MKKAGDSPEKGIRLSLVKMMLRHTKLALSAGHYADARDYVRAVLVLYPKSTSARRLLDKIKTRIQEGKK